MGPSTKCKTFVQKHKKLLNNKTLSSAYFLCSCICTMLHQISVEKHQYKDKMKNFKTVTGTELKQRIKICKSIQVRFPDGWVYNWERSEKDRDRERERPRDGKKDRRQNEGRESWLRYSLLHNVGTKRDFPGGSDGKASVHNAGDRGSIPELGRSPGEGNGNPLQLPGKSHGQRSLVDYSPWGHKES